MSIFFDETSVKWNYKGNEYEYQINGIRSASMDKKNIYVLSYDSNKKEYTHYYISLIGVFLLSFSEIPSKIKNSITLLDESKEEIKIFFQYLHDVRVDDKNIYVIAKEDNKEKLIKYTLYGKKINEYNPPIGCTFERFFSLIENDKEIHVICNGNEDERGHWQWCFVLNTETGEWKKMQSIDGH